MYKIDALRRIRISALSRGKTGRIGGSALAVISDGVDGVLGIGEQTGRVEQRWMVDPSSSENDERRNGFTILLL